MQPMGTVVTYNGVKLVNCLTKEFLQEPQREPSNTDQEHQKFRIVVESIVNYDTFSENNPDLGVARAGAPVSPTSPNAPGVIVSARKFLAEDRKNFLMTIDDTTLLAATPLLDVNSGPKVIHSRITSLPAETFRFEFAIEISIVDCTPQSQTFKVLNNRWSCTDDIDEMFRVTRHWQGRLRIANVALNAHMFRGMVVPRLQRGWKRKRMHFTAAPNGLELHYEIVDQELAGEAPLRPAFKMAITHSEAMTFGGANSVGEVSVRLEGTRRSNKIDLVKRAMQVIVAKLQLHVLKSGQGLIEHLMILDYSGDDQNIVEGRALLRRPVTATGNQTPGEALGAIVLATMGVSLEQLGLPNHDDSTCPNFGPHPATLAGLFACYVQSPCIDQHGMPQVVGETPQGGGDDHGNEDTQPTFSIENLPPLNSPKLSDQHGQFIYNFAQAESTVFRNENTVDLPIGRARNDKSPKTTMTVRLAPPTARRRIRMAAERVGAWPMLWKPANFKDGQGIKHTLLDFSANCHAPQINSIGDFFYNVEAEYLYSLDEVPNESTSFPVPALPWDQLSSEDARITGDAFIHPEAEKGLK
jgi:hypothetical protein